MRLQVIGDPVLHSKSPVLHGAMLSALGLDAAYDARVVRRGELPDYLRWARDHGVAGFNATMPHKEDLLPLLDGRWVGFNTDGAGALSALGEVLGFDPAGSTVTLLGAGGAAKAVALALAQAGAERVRVCNRTLKRAGELCARHPRLTPAPFDPDTLERLCRGADLLVNCTSLGMEGCPRQFEGFSFLDALPPHGAVFDLIYHPAETELLAQARRRGLRAMNGLPMLVWQAVLALEHFLNRPLDRGAMAAAASAALGHKPLF